MRQPGWHSRHTRWQQTFHELASAFELRRLLDADLGDLAPAVAAAVAAHHGHFFSSMQVANARRPGEPPAWATARSEIHSAYTTTLQSVRSSITGCACPDLPHLAWLAGLTSVADWIGSNTAWFLPGERHATLAGHHREALRLADTALDAIGWPQHRALLQASASTDDLIARIVGQPGLSARPLQTAADLLPASAHEPVLLIVEAPMGEGKTELALLAHLRLQATLTHRGLYLALPTQATGNAMFDRALRFPRAFEHEQPLDLQCLRHVHRRPDRVVAGLAQGTGLMNRLGGDVAGRTPGVPHRRGDEPNWPTAGPGASGSACSALGI
jgi:CRISPR-associated endonuclease/helicase Cas3